MKNQIVNIYQKPLTFEDFEGKAKLISEYRSDEGDGISMWEVEFWDERGTTYLRTICTSLHADNRPFGTHPEMDDVDYWHNRAKQLGAVWSKQRTEFLIAHNR